MKTTNSDLCFVRADRDQIARHLSSGRQTDRQLICVAGPETNSNAVETSDGMETTVMCVNHAPYLVAFLLDTMKWLCKSMARYILLAAESDTTWRRSDNCNYHLLAFSLSPSCLALSKATGEKLVTDRN